MRSSYFDSLYTMRFSDGIEKAEFGIGDFRLRCKINIPDELRRKIVTSQDFCIDFDLYKITDSGDSTISSEQRIFYYTETSYGWALPNNSNPKNDYELTVLYRNFDNTKYYDLVNPLSSKELVDAWFQRLLKESSASIEQYLK